MKLSTFFITALLLAAHPLQARIEVADVVSGKFQAEGLGGITTTPDEGYYLTSANGTHILRTSFKSGETDTLFSLPTARGGELVSSFSDFILSPNGQTLLIETQPERVFRHSCIATYYIFDIKNNRLTPLSGEGPQRSPKYSPDGHNICFARQGNLFLVKLLYNNAEIQVTRDGMEGQIQNGIPDWAYEEEFGITSAFSFSADSKMLAWVRFDKSHIPHYTLPNFLTRPVAESSAQSLITPQPVEYPVAGAVCSNVSVNTFEIKSSVIRRMDLTLDSTTYIPRVEFVDNSKGSLAIFTINRNQNRLEIFEANPLSTVCRMILREEDECYLEPDAYIDTKFFGGSFVMQSERSGYNHLYLYNLNGTLIRQLTKGDWNVLAFHGFDPKSGTVWYSANTAGTHESNLYKCDSKGRATCLTPEKGWHTAISSGTDCKYFVDTFSELDTPPSVTVLDGSGKPLRQLISNSSLAWAVREEGFVKRELFSFKTSDGVELYGLLFKPEKISDNAKLPLIIYQYSGPGSYQVMNSWETGFYNGGAWENLLVQEGFAVAIVDSRGTGLRSSTFKKQTYMRLGVMEAKDQVEAAKYLATLPFVDSGRIGIWGWSYGGYTTLMAMSDKNNKGIFRAGVAVAPVTDWRLYDAPYTERFMRQPKENFEGYLESSALERVKDLQGKLLLVHGLNDDNVFFTNSTAYITALVEHEKQFDLMVYPGKEHSIRGSAYRNHLLGKILDFFKANL